MDCALLIVVFGYLVAGALVLNGIHMVSAERARTAIWGELRGDAARWIGVVSILFGIISFLIVCMFVYVMPS